MDARVPEDYDERRFWFRDDVEALMKLLLGDGFSEEEAKVKVHKKFHPDSADDSAPVFKEGDDAPDPEWDAGSGEPEHPNGDGGGEAPEPGSGDSVLGGPQEGEGQTPGEAVDLALIGEEDGRS